MKVNNGEFFLVVVFCLFLVFFIIVKRMLYDRYLRFFVGFWDLLGVAVGVVVRFGGLVVGVLLDWIRRMISLGFIGVVFLGVVRDVN